MKPKILLLDEPCKDAIGILEKEFELVRSWIIFEDISKYRECVGIYVGLSNLSLHEIPKNLKFIGCPCTDISHITKNTSSNKIKIIHLDQKWKDTEGRSVTSTAEHTWSLILQLAKLKRMQLSGKTLGIIGYGRIGQQVSKYAESFNMDVVYYDDKSEQWDFYIDMNDYFYDVIEKSHIITIHVPLNDETKGMIGKEQFDLMKDDALLINTSRPDIIDKYELQKAIETKRIYYADDFLGWLPSYEEYNVIQTPHIGGNCFEAREMTDIYIANQLVKYIKGECL